MMTQGEKAEKFDAVVSRLWELAMHGSLLQSTIASVLIRELELPGPDGEDPEEA